MRFRKKLAAALLTLFAVLAFAPAAAFAAGVETIIHVGDETLSGSVEHPAYAVTTDGKAEMAGASEGNYNIKWDGETLTLRNAKVTEGYYADDWGTRATIYCWSGFAIELVDDNVVEGPSSDSEPSAGTYESAGIYVNGSLAISGTGTLKAVGGAVEAENEASSHGISVEGSLSVSNATIETAGGMANGSLDLSDAFSGGVEVGEAFHMASGAVKAYGGEATGAFSGSYGIIADTVAIDSGTVEACGNVAISTGSEVTGYAYSMGITSYSGLAITGGEVTATSGRTVVEGSMDSYSHGVDSYGGVQIKDAAVSVQGDEASYSAGIASSDAAERSIVIESADVRAVGGRASVSSAGIRAEYGGIVITGGEVDATVGINEGDSAYGIYACCDIAINGGKVEASGMREYMDGVEPDYASGIFSGVGSITIAGNDTVVNATSGYAHEGVTAIEAWGGNILIQGGTVQADGASCYNPWSMGSEDDFIGYGLSAQKGADGVGGGSIIISGGSVAAVGFTDSLSYGRELIVRPGDGKIAASVLDDWMAVPETYYEVDWVTMAESALEIEGSPFAEETAIERALTKGERYFLAVGIATEPIDPVDPEEPTDPEDPVDPEEPVDPIDPVEPVDPVDPEKPVDPVGPEEPTNPVDPDEPAEPTDPTDPADPAGPTDPTGSEDPAGAEDPADPADPMDSGKQAGKTNKTSKTSKTSKNGTLPQTGDGGSLTVCFALLLASASAMIAAATVRSREEKRALGRARSALRVRG